MEAFKTWLAETDPGALMLFGFLGLVIFLSGYAFLHWSKRKKALLEMMPRLGYQVIEEPSPKDLIPELLFHPDEFEPPKSGGGRTEDIVPRVPMAWRGRLAGRDVTVMDVTISRLHGHRAHEERSAFTLNRTVLRCSTPTGEPPPDLLITEKVLFKGRVKHHRTVGGAETFGEHYFVFSDAGDDWLARWITPALQEVLGRYRLWNLATHNGVVYLCRGSKLEEPHEIESFLREGEELLAAFLEAAG